MRLKPLGDRVVVKLVEAKEETESGIILGDAKKQPKIAEVLAVGSKIEEDEKKKEEIKVGDKVVYSEYSGKNVEMDDEEYIILNYNDILATIK